MPFIYLHHIKGLKHVCQHGCLNCWHEHHEPGNTLGKEGLPHLRTAAGSGHVLKQEGANV